MLSILAPARPAVKSSRVMSDAEFSRWCAAQAANIDAPSLSLDPYEPTFAEQCAELGRTIGLTGSTNGFFDLFPSATDADARNAGIAFTSARTAANRVHARQTGYELGVNGQHCDRPESVHHRFDREFTAGWQAGADEWADRQEVLEEDDRQDWAVWQELGCAANDPIALIHDVEIAEAGGWRRATRTSDLVE